MSSWVNQLWASQSPHIGLLVKHIPDYPTTIDGNFVDGGRRGCCVSFVDPTRRGFDSTSPQSYETHEFPFSPQNQDLFITSCEGLILFENLRGTITTVCNPTTKMLKFLPRPVRDDKSPLQSRVMHVATGLGKDCSSNRFKVVRIFYYYYYSGQEIDENCVRERAVVQVYTLKNNVKFEKWRNISCPDFVAADIICARSTYVDGSYYWITGVVAGELLAFDFATEEFSISSLPIDENLAHMHLYQLFSCNGNLTLVGYNRQGESGGAGGNLFVFWYLDTSSSSSSPHWTIINRLRFHLDVVRPIYVHSGFAFLEKKSGEDNISVIIVHPLFDLEGIDESFVLGFYDYTELTKVVTYDKRPYNYPLSNAQQMNGNYCFEEDGGDDDINY